MPALPVIADTFRIAMHWTDGAGQNAVNVIHTKSAASAVASDVMELLDDTVTSNMWPSVATGCHVDDVAITPLDGTSATAHFSPGTPGNWTGGAGSAEYEPQISVIVKLTTLHRGRSFRGRVYLPFTAESVVSKGAVDPTIAGDITTAWQTFVGALESDPTTSSSLVVASYKLAVATDVISVLGEAEAATQRRRQGRNRGA
jgi:hypothetical protein